MKKASFANNIEQFWEKIRKSGTVGKGKIIDMDDEELFRSHFKTSDCFQGQSEGAMIKRSIQGEGVCEHF